MVLYENFRIALNALSSNKMRSVLTTLGIIIGVAAVIAVVSIVQGLSYLITSQLEEMGADYILVVPYRPPGEEGQKLGRIELTHDDGLAILNEASRISNYTPLFQRSAVVKYGNEHALTRVYGATASYQDINNHYVERGRFLSPIDLSHRKKVCAIGIEVIKNLDIKGNPIGKMIHIGNKSFVIIGIMEEKGRALGENSDDICIIPFAAAELLFGKEATRQILLNFKASSTTHVEEAKEQITDILRRRHSLKKDDPNDFRVMVQDDILERVNSILGGVTATVAGIVGIALLVGGIGIMNIMLVSVTERTREIGIRKAVGAKRRDIVIQFLIEAVCLSLVGGLIGVILGYIMGDIGARLIPDFPQAHVPLWAIALGLGFSIAVGLFFGIYPAAKAGRLNPIEALRYE
jgi:putative ABC transport system permease protein